MVRILNDKLEFPPVVEAAEDGLLAIGGDLSDQRLLLAYRHGIFPWFSEDEPIMWWCPDPRFVLFPEELKVSKSMQQIIRKDKFEYRCNAAFESVIQNCRKINRPGQDGTWITNEIIKAYTSLHQQGYAISAETYRNGKLCGGLYGILLGKIFFGESMFSLEANASKFAFIHLVKGLKEKGVTLIDCQIYTPHLESFGARMIPRSTFTQILQENIR